MVALAVAAVAFLCSAAGAAVGMSIRSRMPVHHLSDDYREAIKLGSSLMGTLLALVLGLLLGAATSSFDNSSTDVARLANDLVLLNRLLQGYEVDTTAARATLKDLLHETVTRFWPNKESRAPGFGAQQITEQGSRLYAEIRALPTENDTQRTLKQQMLEMALELARLRSGLIQGEGASISRPYLVVLMFWLAAMFTTIGFFAPLNHSSIFFQLIFALAVCAGLLLIVDLGRPFEGFLQVSRQPLRDALLALGD